MFVAQFTQDFDNKLHQQVAVSKVPLRGGQGTVLATMWTLLYTKIDTAWQQCERFT
jgi:hypothetical protein